MTVDTILITLIVGTIAGWLAGEVWRGYGFGLIGNLIVGIAGSLVGAFLFNAVTSGSDRIIGSLAAALVGALLLLFAAQGLAQAARIA